MLAVGMTSCAGPPQNSVEAACRQSAYDDPDVKDAILRSNSQMQQVRGPALIELEQLVQTKTRHCLAVQGLAPPGGVESVKPY